MSMPHTSLAPRSRLWLAVEFAAFYVAAPLVMALAFPPGWMFPVLFAFTLAGLVLLALTPGFRWRELGHGLFRMSPGLILFVTLGTAAIGYAVVQATTPRAFLYLPRYNPELMLMIAALYPFLSALPQELVFRALFFRRYEAILPRAPALSIPLNAALFSFAHLMYWSWVVTLMTFAGGLLFAYSYRYRRNFPEAVVTHSLAGIVVFALGLGVFFYSGNAARPF